MLHFIFSGLIAVTFMMSPVNAQASSAEKLAAAKKLEKQMPVKGMMDDMFKKLVGNPQLPLSEDDINQLSDSMDIASLQTAAIKAMAKHFTVKEMNAMHDFYGKLEGKSIMAKYPAYMSEIMPEIQQQVAQGMQTIMTKKLQNNQ